MKCSNAGEEEGTKNNDDESFQEPYFKKNQSNEAGLPEDGDLSFETQRNGRGEGNKNKKRGDIYKVTSPKGSQSKKLTLRDYINLNQLSGKAK